MAAPAPQIPGRFETLFGFRASLVSELTRHVLLKDRRVGFVAVQAYARRVRVGSLYIRPDCQRQGLGSGILAIVLDEADARGQPLRVAALRGSESNRICLRHGFILEEEAEWDIYYVRPAVRWVG
jgi:GNAT superfamily N-acetyltransferase